jgi:hypothetical protein
VVRIASSEIMVRQKRGRGRREWMTITASSSTLRRITTIWHHSKAVEHSSMREINAVWPRRPLTDMFQLTTSVLDAGAQRITAQPEARRRLSGRPMAWC